MAETSNLPDEPEGAQVRASLARFLGSVPLGGRATLIIAALATLAAIAAIILLGSQPEFKVLYSGLPEEEAGRVVEQLTKMTIPYQLDMGGTVRIPSSKIYDVRLQLATMGMPKSEGVGFEIFDKTNLMGMTDFMERMNYQRALQGELARTIESIATVRGVRVHLVMPKRSLFVSQDEKPSASVVLDLARPLEPAQAQGIIHLISAAVEGLAENDITLVDQKGNLVAGGKKDPGDGSLPAEEGLALQKRMENSLEERVQTMLDRVLGPSRAITRITAELDLSRVERQEEKFDPEGQVARSEQTTTEASRGNFGVGGVPGVRPNDANDSAQAGSTGSNQSRDVERETVNYEISKTINRILLPVGTVKRMSVAVLVDGIYEKNEKGEQVYKTRSEDEMANLKKIIEQAVGFRRDRGDSIEVTNIPFEPLSIAEVERGPLADREMVFQLAKYLGLFILIMVLIFSVLRPMLRKLLVPEKKPMSTGLPTTVADLEAQLLAEGVGAGADSPARVMIPDRTLQMSQQMVTDYSEEAREIIRYWMTQDEN